MAIGVLKFNRKYVPCEMCDKSIMKNKQLKWMNYRMHTSGRICCVVWKDRVPILILSMHAEAATHDGEEATMKRKSKGGKKDVPTGPMHLQY